MSLQRLACPACGANVFSRDPDGYLVCGACGSVFQQTRHMECPTCRAMNPEDARRCIQCGAALVRQCPICQHRNAPDAEYCGNCGETLDALAFVMQRYEEASSHSVVRRAELFGAVKRQDNEYMRAQRERLDAEERERMARLEVVNEQARRQQKLVLVVGVTIGVLALLFMIVLIIVQTSGGG